MFANPGTNAIARIFLSFVRERIEVRVIRKRAFTNAFDSSPSPQSTGRGTPSLIAYKFFFVQVSMRSSAFSMFSIELATLKRK
jgi:hypothetical protein